MPATGSSGLRLAALLRRFGLKQSDFVRQDPKSMIAAVKVEFYRQAKEQHPDRAAENEKDKAAERFVQLKEDLQEAIKLIEAGIQPPRTEPSAYVKHAPMGGWQHPGRYMYERPYWHATPDVYTPPVEQEFDTKTRVKGHLFLWTGLFCFFTGLREFLVWSAGSTYSWKPPQGSNPFWVRRYMGSWAEHERKERAESLQHQAHQPTKAIKEKAESLQHQAHQSTSAIKEKTPKSERRVDNFYQKRRVGNRRGERVPRSHGTKL